MRTGYNDNLRVSDAERSEVADRLAVHYGDGRLDKEEFDERVARAMSAKTRADLNGLFDDLPDLGDRGGAVGAEPADGNSSQLPGYRAGRARRRGHPILVLALAIFLVSLTWHGLAHIFFIPWFAIMVLVVAVILANRFSRRSHRDR
jgi:hypothetical protein